ncbi:unnamed protein product [Lactuca virosa]|uniref:PWWP domain-containing protein n=1 Tax=Lactuca virosa TaxID=75947 RepID=A0AAU9MYI1_9ASTR|nr:unnamed protein product [Lactuca virosa]
MKEEDDVLPTVKESTATVDSTTADETVTLRGKIEGLFGERDEGEDMVVDVVGADVVVDDRGGTRVDLEGKVGINGLMEEGSTREIQSSDMDVDQVGVVEEVRVVTLEKVEVVVNDEGVKTSVEVSKEVIQENVVTTVVSAMDCDAQKSSEEPETGGGESAVRDNNRNSTKEIVEQHTESAQELADGDHVMDETTGKESDVSNSLNFPESFTTTVNPGSRDAHVAAVKEGLFGKDEGEDGVDNQVSSTEALNEGITADNVHVSPENLEQQSGDDETRKEILQPTVEVATNDVQDSGNGTQAGDSNAALQSLGGEVQLAGGEGEAERGLAEETVEQGMESVQEVADGLVVEEGLAGKGEAQDGVSKDPSSESTDNPNVEEGLTEKQATESVQEVADVDSTKILESVSKVDKVIVEEVLAGKDKTQDVILSGGVNAGTGEGSVQENAQKSEVQMSKEETSHSTTGVRIDNDQKSGIDTTDKKEESERGLVKEIVEQPMSSIQEMVNKDHVMDEKPEKEVEVLDLSKVQESSTMVVDQKTEVDPTPKDESLHTTIEVMTADASHKSLNVANEVTTAQNLPNHEVQVSSVGGILVENQILNVDTEMKVSQTSVETFEEVNHATSHADYGEDAGMDIDEVLGWKDEIPGIDSLHGQEKDQDFKINTNPEANFEHGLSKPLVYERRVQVNDDVEEHTDFCRQQETETLEVEQSTLTDDVSEPLDNETSVSFHQSCYFHPPENEGEFSASDLVWGKVRSHPWWPGQIFDSSDASDKAMKYHKKDRFLVGYFGDRTFAWNDSTVLKPFRAKFSQIEKHTNSEAFNNALHCALEEVSRRVELGLACSCTPHDIYKKIECQIVENAGIKKESSKRHGMDKTALVTSFEPDKLIDYVRLLAKSPYDENDKMDLVMAKAQLLSCARYKGYRQLSEFQFCGTLLEDSSGLTQGVDQVIKKERIFSDLKVDPTYYPGNSEEGSRKRKASDSNSNSNSDVSVPEKRPTLETVTPSPKPSFKVGELIQRVANQLSDKNVEPVDQTVGLSHSVQSPVNMVNPVNPQANLPEMLSQLQLTAQDPMKGVNETRKRKPSNENDPEDFEFDDVNDSYWTDRIIQNHPEDLQLQPAVVVHDNNQNGGVEHPHQIVAYEEKQKPVKQSRRSNKKRFFSSNHEIEAKEQSELIERRRLNLATEVLMKFTEGIYFPSEIHLNKMFRRFGPLMESETEVDRQSGRARVVFKKCSDAEVAHSSAGKFNIFGSIVPRMHASNGEIIGSSSKWLGVTVMMCKIWM